jgi:hypothetical protein
MGMKIRIEPKRIDRVANTVETVPLSAVEFWGLLVQRTDEEFGETYWEWISDHPTLHAAYARSVSLGDPTPTLRAA